MPCDCMYRGTMLDINTRIAIVLGINQDPCPLAKRNKKGSWGFACKPLDARNIKHQTECLWFWPSLFTQLHRYPHNKPVRLGQKGRYLQVASLFHGLFTGLFTYKQLALVVPSVVLKTSGAFLLVKQGIQRDGGANECLIPR